MSVLDGLIEEARSAVATAEAVAERATRDARAFLASPQGRQARANVARGLVTVAPLLAAAPVLRRTWVGVLRHCGSGPRRCRRGRVILRRSKRGTTGKRMCRRIPR